MVSALVLVLSLDSSAASPIELLCECIWSCFCFCFSKRDHTPNESATYWCSKARSRRCFLAIPLRTHRGTSSIRSDMTIVTPTIRWSRISITTTLYVSSLKASLPPPTASGMYKCRCDDRRASKLQLQMMANREMDCRQYSHAPMPDLPYKRGLC